MSERLRDDDAPWGKTRAQFAFEHAQQARERSRRRREAFRRQMQAGGSGTFERIFVPIGAAGAYDDDWHLPVERRDDTRNLTGKLLGDPVPGRSALDLRRMK